MGFFGCLALLAILLTVNSASCHHHHRGVHADDRKKSEPVDHAKRFADREEENVVLTEGENRRSSIGEESKVAVPFSERRLEKMLEKAIMKIITGDLSTGDMLLLKSLNYSLEEVLAIRERELNKKRDEELRKKESMKSWSKTIYGDGDKKSRYRDKSSMDRASSRNSDFEAKKEGKKNRHVDKSFYKDFDFEAYNRQAILDYENLPSNLEFQQPWSEPTASDYEEVSKVSKEEEVANNLHREFDRAMEPHVVFKIRYDDSEFDSSSGSDESNRNRPKTTKHHSSLTTRHTTSRNLGNSFHASTQQSTLSTTTTTTLPLVYQLSNSNVRGNYLSNDYSTTTSSTPSTAATTESAILDEVSRDENGTNIIVEANNFTDEAATSKIEEEPRENVRTSTLAGLEWVEDDVYRVIPELVDSLSFENTEENETSDYENANHDSQANWNTEENENDTSEYQNSAPDSVKLFMANSNVSESNLPLANLSTYLQVAIAHRRGQGEKAIEDIKSRVLALTGRFNLSANANQVQRERLTMFSPTCQIPRNTDQDAWTDVYSMNMHFQLNLTSSDHVVAAKLRIYKLPQENLTLSSESTFEEEEEDEKKIRISVYYYTKSLKRHRSKKRLMDSVVTPLTSNGTHLALDVRQGLRFWRLNPRNSHGNGSNHGLVIQVEDQDGRPLKPALYIQQPSCADQDTDQKAYQRKPALFVQACTRYVRIVNGKTETYVNCRH